MLPRPSRRSDRFFLLPLVLFAGIGCQSEEPQPKGAAVQPQTQATQRAPQKRGELPSPGPTYYRDPLSPTGWTDLLSDKEPEIFGFEKVDLSGVQFVNRHALKGTFEQVNLTGSNFSESTLLGFTFEDSNLEGSDFSKAYILGLEVRDSRLENTSFSEAHFSYSELQNSHLSKVNFKKTTFLDTRLSDSNLRDSDFSKTLLDRIQFIRSDLRGAKFDLAVFFFKTQSEKLETESSIGNAFIDCDLRGVDFRKTAFWNVYFSGSDLREALLPLHGAIDDVSCDDTNLWPEGVTPPPCHFQALRKKEERANSSEGAAL